MHIGGNTAASVILQNSVGDISYTALNTLNLASLSDDASGTVTLNSLPDPRHQGLITLNGLVSAGDVTLTSNVIKEVGAGAIQASDLSLQAQGVVTLDGANQIARIDSGNAASLSLIDGQALAIVGGLTVQNGGTMSLTTTSGNIGVNGMIGGGTLDLTSQTGSLTESNTKGGITAGTLNATAHTGISLNSPNNQITTVGIDHTDSGPNRIQQ